MEGILWVINKLHNNKIVTLLRNIIIPATEKKITIVLEELSASLDFKASSKNIFFSVAIVSICIIYICVWIPMIMSLRKKVSVINFNYR